MGFDRCHASSSLGGCVRVLGTFLLPGLGEEARQLRGAGGFGAVPGTGG